MLADEFLEVHAEHLAAECEVHSVMDVPFLIHACAQTRLTQDPSAAVLDDPCAHSPQDVFFGSEFENHTFDALHVKQI